MPIQLAKKPLEKLLEKILEKPLEIGIKGDVGWMKIHQIGKTQLHFLITGILVDLSRCHVFNNVIAAVCLQFRNGKKHRGITTPQNSLCQCWSGSLSVTTELIKGRMAAWQEVQPHAAILQHHWSLTYKINKWTAEGKLVTSWPCWGKCIMRNVQDQKVYVFCPISRVIGFELWG